MVIIRLDPNSNNFRHKNFDIGSRINLKSGPQFAQIWKGDTAARFYLAGMKKNSRKRGDKFVYENTISLFIKIQSSLVMIESHIV